MHTGDRSALDAIESALSSRLSATVRVARIEPIPYSQVVRCVLESTYSAVPSTVVVRRPRDGHRSGVGPLRNEASALEYLESIGCAPAPRCLACDLNQGFIITEDLGDGPSLLDHLLANDVEAARAGVIAFASALGELHAATAEGDARDTTLSTHIGFDLLADWREVIHAARDLGLPTPERVEPELAYLDHLVHHPGSLLALSNGDPSFVNCKVTPAGVKFFDFEDACFRHPILDAAVFRNPYPTGAPAWELPPDVTQAAESEYRRVLTRAGATIDVDSEYQTLMAASCMIWAIRRLTRLRRVESGPDEDVWPLLPPTWRGPVPRRSRRRQLMHTLQVTVAALQSADSLPVLHAWLETLLQALRHRWAGMTIEVPMYPAFDSQHQVMDARVGPC